jgi:hypothetical protein
MSLEMGTHHFLPFEFTEADLTSNTVLEFVAPVTGWVTSLRTTIQKAITTGGTLTLKAGTAGTVNVAGAALTIADAAAVGTRALAKTTAGDGSCQVTAGDRIRLVPASFATAGRVRGVIGFNSAGNNG